MQTDDLKFTPLHYSSIYSRHGQDGYIAEIFNRVKPTNKRFLEIGIQTGVECNTRYLLESGWSGVWIEGSDEFATAAAEKLSSFIATGQLKIVNAFLTPENVNAVVKAAMSDSVVDFASVDVDQHTHFIWNALQLPARVACVEYNSSLPMNQPICVPYDEKAVWNGTNYFGASLKTIEMIGRSKHMSLVGCDSMGVDAFFVDSKLVEGLFASPFSSQNHFVGPHFGHYKDHRWIGWAGDAIPKQWITWNNT